jgi:hypothetical protein
MTPGIALDSGEFVPAAELNEHVQKPPEIEHEEVDMSKTTSDFDAADMATAAAQGFRDGVASVVAENTNTERAKFEKWALENRLGEYTEQMGFRFFDAGDGYPSWKAWQARASLPLPAAGQEPVAWTGGEEWEQLAWHLCAEENGEESCGELIWEGGPVPEPWGERWLKYEGEAKRMIELVRKFAAPQPAVAAGWVMVPADPTLDMGWAYLDAARESEPLKTHSFNHEGYRAMLKAAPIPPAPSTEGEGNG